MELHKITGKWSDTSDLKIPNLKVLSTKVFLRMWSIVVTVFLATLGGFFYGRNHAILMYYI